MKFKNHLDCRTCKKNYELKLSKNIVAKVKKIKIN